MGDEMVGVRGVVYRLAVWVVVCLGAVMALSMLLPGEAEAYEPWWVQVHRATELWSGPDSRAVAFGPIEQWAYLQVVEPQDGPRLHVYNPVTQNYAYVEASAVGPSGPWPGARSGVTAEGMWELPRAVPAQEGGNVAWWVSNFIETELWGGPGAGAASLGRVPQFRRFLVLEPQRGARLRVWSPEQNRIGYVDASAVGPSGPSVWTRVGPPKVVRAVGLPGRAVSVPHEAVLRSLPVVDEETEVKALPNNAPVEVRDLVIGADGGEWYSLEGGGFIRAEEVRLPRAVATVGSRSGRWIDADLMEPTLVTAYEGSRVVRTMLAIRGVGETPTRPGTFRIVRRVERETMDSETIGIPRDSPKGYLLKDVLYTQYFTTDGAALHYNWWLGQFGFEGSHGCLGLSLEDARWLWEWADVGTPVVVRDAGSSAALGAGGDGAQ